jgi:hypothetical protein
MKRFLSKPVYLAVVAVVALAMSSSVARAAMELGFSGGLSGWTVSVPNGATVTGGTATMYESPTAETDLYKVFTLPVGATTLSFTLQAILPDPSGFNPPDFFNAALLKPVGGPSLVWTTDPLSSDSYYIRDVSNGLPAGTAAKGVTVVPDPTPLDQPLPITVKLDLSGWSSLAGKDVEVLFRLSGTAPDSQSKISISDVTIDGTGSGGPVPEPGSLVQFFGLFGLAAVGWRFGKRKKLAVV